MVKSYLSYLLRLWQVATGRGMAWRASLEEVSTGERQAFAGLDSLLDYLREQARAGSPPEESGRDTDRREEVER